MKDKLHQHVINALRKDGWMITADQLRVHWKQHRLLIDLGAEKVLVAQKENRRIAVEIKSFLNSSDMDELYRALGQYVIYRRSLRRKDPFRTLFLALDREAFREHFDDPEGEALRLEQGINLLVFDKTTEEIVLWKQ
jgi:XisH protein